MIIGFKRILALAAGITFCGAVYATVFTVSPGNLGKLLDSHKEIEDGVITLKGRIDVRDLYALKNIPSGLEELDLSEVTVAAYSNQDSPFEGRSYYQSEYIPDYSMFGLKVKKLSLPRSVVEIGQGALAGAAIESVTLPESLATIGNYAFYDCGSLKEIKFPSTLTYVGESSFGNCSSLKTVSLASTGVKSIPKRFLRGCTSLESVVMPQGVSEIGAETFAGTAITSITLDNTGAAAPYALSGMKNLKDVTLRGNGEAATGLLFGDSSLESVSGAPVDVPDLFVAGCTGLDISKIVSNALSLGSFSFAGGAESNLVLGEGLKFVDSDVFTGLSNLNFIDATSLKSGLPDVAQGAFDPINPGEITLYVMPDNYEKWVEHPEWGKFKVMETNRSVDKLYSDSDSANIVCRQNGLGIEVSASVEIDMIGVYSVDGQILASLNPGSDHATVDVDLAGESVVVVRVDVGSVVKIFKLVVNK